VSGQSKERAYLVVQNEGKITWRVEELWDGGLVRGPFGAKESAIRREERIARAEGFFDALVLAEAGSQESKRSPAKAFEKVSDTTWRCIDPVSLDIGNATIVVGKGTTFVRGIPFLGVDVVKWLDEHSST